MSEAFQNHSSNLAHFTRVKRHKKTPRKTVGITLPPKLIEEARKHKLNISRICEQALQSVIEYLAQQNQTESSKSFGEAFLQRKGSWAGSLARLGHPLDVRKVAGSNPARPTINAAYIACIIEVVPRNSSIVFGLKISSFVFGRCLPIFGINPAASVPSLQTIACSKSPRGSMVMMSLWHLAFFMAFHVSGWEAPRTISLSKRVFTHLL